MDAGSNLSSYQKTRRRVLAVLLALLGLVLVFGASLQPEGIHDRIEAYGVILIVAGILGRLWSILYIGGKKSSAVVSAGPYSITRNPLYLFSTVAAAGAGAQMGSYLAAVLLAILCAAAFHVVILREEKYLAGELGDAYNSYKARVPRFFPSLFIYSDLKEVTFRPKILKQTLIDGLVFFLSIPAFELIEKGQETDIIPVFFHLY